MKWLLAFSPSARRCAFVALTLALNATWLSPAVAGAPSEKTADVLQSSAKPAASTATASRSSRKFNEAQYAKASELSVRPSPVGNINVPSPDKAVPNGIVTTKITLFIDEKGAVTKIAFDDAALAQPFRDSVQSAFTKARFKPGRKGDRAVKARMRIEVTFEPKPANPPNTGASGATAQR